MNVHLGKTKKVSGGGGNKARIFLLVDLQTLLL